MQLIFCPKDAYADRVFDGFKLHENAAVTHKIERIVEVGARDKTPALPEVI